MPRRRNGLNELAYLELSASARCCPRELVNDTGPSGSHSSDFAFVWDIPLRKEVSLRVSYTMAIAYSRTAFTHNSDILNTKFFVLSWSWTSHESPKQPYGCTVCQSFTVRIRCFETKPCNSRVRQSILYKHCLKTLRAAAIVDNGKGYILLSSDRLDPARYFQTTFSAKSW